MVEPLALAGLPFLLVGGLVLQYGGRLALGLYRRHRQTRTVEAEIREVSATEIDEGVFEPTVRFRYRFDGQTYDSTLVREGSEPPTGSRELVDSYLAEFEEGETVTATLLSSMPDQAVLERSTNQWPYVVAVVATLLGVAFTALGSGIVVAGVL
ncbi:DUF3592 domain-containing protein [Halapricum hydrolyticum]|uniref:DUF3592 domain-containing protein n=1 Tax=Halapricum hydrolyticum TaxID=2979991 RepID=A0AAE3IC28_9EURY|nr:DUF3592 domain-containing protein [Halapricum hydrolyticum]MCU4718658.1 DUF3592 domain-containing protein [Halapricum hydrolyticum]MCU4727656.1 DUF3592 domain-containing protein [Halapricum hydrolyticum]